MFIDRDKFLPVLLGFALSVMSAIAVANPTGGEVVAGQGRIVQTSAMRMDVLQHSSRLGIDWQDFSIGPGEQVNFDQPSSSAIVLNRVTGPGTSNIEGLLTANGNVFVVNRNGVIFHKSAVVDVGGLLATTVDLSNEDFLAGRYRFARGLNPQGRVVNEGRITAADGGLVALVAPSVRNAGVIQARLGRVALASGNTYTLDLFGDRLVTFAVGDEVAQKLVGLDGEGIDALVDHSGAIDAPGGQVLLSAHAAKGVVDNVINLTGVVQAQTVSSRQGRIVLAGGQSGSVRVSGQLDAAGGDGAGGDIEVMGETIALASSAKLDATGAAGGGTVLIGGDYQGLGPRQRALYTTVEAGAVIRADATVNGDGGTIVVWSDEHTRVDGELSARGGPSGGDGGLIETSSAGVLAFSGSVRVSAPAGRAGTWLLDPEDIDIDRGMADSIEDTLNEGGNVSIKTSDGGEGDGNIYVNASITKTEGDDASLSMQAHGRIDVNKPIRSTKGKLDVSLKAGKAVNVKADIDTNGGDFSSRISGTAEQPKEGSGEGNEEDNEEVNEEDSGEVAAEEAEEEPAEPEAEVVDSDEQADTAGEDDTSVADSEPSESGESAGESADEQSQEVTVELVDGDEVEVEAEDKEAVADAVEAVAEGIESSTHAATSADPGTAAQPETASITVSETVTTGGGDISVDAGDAGVTLVTGTLDASMEDGSGGDIEVLGQHVVIAGEALIDASGDEGGGDIHIGGDYQGKGDRRRSKTTTIGKHVTIKSDAKVEGDAGRVVVWSDGTTRYSGHISARGGAEGGDGGLVEVSGKQNLGFWGTVDAAAPNGTAGSLLLDPETLTIIDAERGDGELDLDILCDGNDANCWMPALLLGMTPAEYAALGIDPDPETPLNTVSWGRLIQMAEVTGLGIKLLAEQDITFAALNGTMSTQGSPTGDNDGWTITLAVGDPVRERQSGNALAVTSTNGSIVFENPNDNLAVFGGDLVFAAADGLRLGNLYGLGPADEITVDTGWRNSSVYLTSGTGDIEVGTINTRNRPDRFADPVTGAPQPQELMIDGAGPVDFDALDAQTLFSDLSRGGAVRITSTFGDINIRGPVYTGTSDFSALTFNGTFTATDIDTGANRILVKRFEGDPGRLNTLHTGNVSITADKISFDRINAGQVDLEAHTYTPDAISGEVVIDNFWQTDILRGTRALSDGGLDISVGDDGGICYGDCIAGLDFEWNDVGDAVTLGLNSGPFLSDADAVLGLDGTVTLNLSSGFSFRGGGPSAGLQGVAPALASGELFLTRGEAGVIPIAVPLNLPSAPAPGSGAAGPAPIEVSLSANDSGGFSGGDSGVFAPLPGPGAPPSKPGPGAEGIAPITTGLKIYSTDEKTVADSEERVQEEGNEDTVGVEEEKEDKTEEEKEKEERAADERGKCAEDNRLEWLQHGVGSAARDLDWGRRSGVGTDPEETKDVFKSENCYFTDTSAVTDADLLQ